MKVRLTERFWSKVDKSADGCWNWMSTRGTRGYGAFKVGRANLRAHRLTYEGAFGPIPPGLVIDHLCRNTGCCNPAHLEAVTQHENTIRGNGWAGLHARQTHCANGHEFTPENTYRWKGGGRACRACRTEKQRQYRAARKGSGA